MQKFAIMHGMQCINNWRVNISTFWIWSHNLIERQKSCHLGTYTIFIYYSLLPHMLTHSWLEKYANYEITKFHN